MTVLMLTLSACKKEESAAAYEKFEGKYDIVSNGSVNILVDDIDFVDELGTVIIKRGDNDDEIFMYVETDFVTDLGPLGVYATAEIEGNEYDMEGRNLTINIDLGGSPLSVSFNVDATGVLSDDGKTLTSEVVFSGSVNGTVNCVGTKEE